MRMWRPLPRTGNCRAGRLRARLWRCCTLTQSVGSSSLQALLQALRQVHHSVVILLHLVSPPSESESFSLGSAFMVLSKV